MNNGIYKYALKRCRLEKICLGSNNFKQLTREEVMENVSVFDEEALRLLVRMRDLLEEILETLDVMADKELMEAIAESEKEIKEGKVREFKEFLKELGL